LSLISVTNYCLMDTAIAAHWANIKMASVLSSLVFQTVHHEGKVRTLLFYSSFRVVTRRPFSRLISLFIVSLSSFWIIEPVIEWVQALADICVWAMLSQKWNLCADCKSAQQCTTKGKLHPGLCSSAACGKGQTQMHDQYTFLRLTWNVITDTCLPQSNSVTKHFANELWLERERERMF